MFKYLVAYLLAPLLRPVFYAVLILFVVAFVITIPAHLWVMYIDPRPSYHQISVLNVATFAFLVCAVVVWRIRRRSVRRRYLPR